jgi:phospholipase C
VLQDAANGTLPAVSWVAPDWLDSDNAAANSDTGPSWVASVVNAIGEGKDWDSTAIFVVWTDWGGWYDNAPPPVRDFRGNGIRTPLIVISPYARAGVVDHANYESASLLKFVELAFGLPLIGPVSHGYTDGRAAAPLAAFDFTQKPRPFVPIAAKYPASYFVHRRGP